MVNLKIGQIWIAHQIYRDWVIWSWDLHFRGQIGITRLDR
jgi:hypothetical protein